MKYVLFLSLLFSLQLHAQEVYTGRILSAKDSTALQGVSIYFDGTSLGTVSNTKGFFKIQNSASNISPLIFRSIGYKTRTVSNISVFKEENYPIVFLEESMDELGTVILETDPWSRKRKLNYFRREFLGNTKASLKCKILNEDAIKLKYSPSKNELMAYAEEPILIKNNHLGYFIEYELIDFTIKFSIGSSGLNLIEYTFYEGSSFYKELKEKPRKRHLKNREEAFEGSLLQFMRSLAKKELAKNDFKIFYDRFQVPEYKYFDIQQEHQFTKVAMTKDTISILHKNNQSGLIYKSPFYIDEFGNFTPTRAFNISGVMGQARMSLCLPLNYAL
ncbi:carboxypeptidase-like regulatory domain-containing protein [Zunongwangia sp. HGR-M22]|uniref:carboxypeptidase-like regulatory domain-containing protein n=1 Tax=Zunongwangia sp. HGR-M22 TaxID=3015168 RepID=UPI0022DE387C|nr:carboxypeptidase-like regulatory domain-containing protein [Zunongwangia sp. HGR-M22]WBL26585.1 carboxypeptidase-like regulatory domain-containing protein [Zunongwangia sp. HGR-M22]